MVSGNNKEHISRNFLSDAFSRSVDLPEKTKKILDERFFKVTPAGGSRIEGVSGFIRWCDERRFDVSQKAAEYVAIFEKYESFRKNGLIEMTKKVQDTFKEDCSIDKAYYADFELWEVFGRTKLEELLQFAKSGNLEMAEEIVKIIRPYVEQVVKECHIEAVGYIPPTVPRDVQLMEILKRGIETSCPKLNLEKKFLEVRVPQKTLRKLSDRIQNAKATIFVTNSERTFDTVLLIDDVMGSGATLNEVAKKIKDQGVAKHVIVFSITGKLQGFDVISEV